MHLSALHVELFARDASSLVGGIVRGVSTTEDGRGVAIRFKDRALILRCAPPSVALVREDATDVADQARGRWGKLDRSRVKDVRAVAGDRVLVVELERADALGVKEQFLVVAELFGARGRVTLCGHSNAILEQIPPSQTKTRARQTYELPRPRRSFLTGERSHVEHVAASCVDRDPVKALVSSGLDDTLAREALHCAGLQAVSNDRDARALADSLSTIVDDIATRPSPCAIIDADGVVVGASPIPLRSVPPDLQSERDSFAGALSDWAIASSEIERARELRSLLRRRVTMIRDRAAHALTKIAQDLTRADRAPELERWGTILMSSGLEEKRGASHVVLADFETSQEATIPLDAKRTPRENAREYFRKARKAREGRETQTRRHAEMTADVAGFDATLARMDSASVGELERLAEKHGVALKRERPSEKKTGPFADLPSDLRPRAFVTSTGWTVLVGRTSKGNDHLTLRIAKPDETWLHARGASGSHVVIRKPDRKREPCDRTISEAASIAAWFSKSKHSSSVPVVVTKAKYVRKPRGAKPGLVSVERERAVMARPGLPKAATTG